ncbi:MAG: phosphomethylpyrimidine synthase ThiC [Phycisphaerae bacterium]|nr:phosphomethylpyrimidine synthase ThiC [Phycisphaerae bacterium]
MRTIGHNGTSHPIVDVAHLTTTTGHPGHRGDARLWVNQTVSQRWSVVNDPNMLKGQSTPKRLDPMGIGRMVTTKINANIGASPVSSSTREEVDKLMWAQKYGADTLMDLSTGGKLDECRQAIIDHSTIPIGTVPIYSMIIGRSIEDLDYDTILKTVERQAKQGVDYFTIHAGVLKENLHLIKNRITGLVSRGGSLLAKWMIVHNKQNPMYELFDEISAIMREYDVTYSLGDGVRPGCLRDAGDAAQIAELEVLGELTQRAREAGVQVMVEGPGHVPLHEIAWNMQVQQRICDDAPFYVLGPLVTDVFPGYDHITSCIGATEAARAGAAMLCYVTPKEHVGLPKAQDVKEGCIAYKIAAHAGDVARQIPGARQWDDDMSKARAALNWPMQFEIAFDGETARALHDEDLDVDTDFCAMCGHDWCSMRISKEIQEFASGKDEQFQPTKKSMKSPGLTQEQVMMLAHRGKKHDCHSDNVTDAEEAKRVQKRYVQIGGAEG